MQTNQAELTHIESVSLLHACRDLTADRLPDTLRAMLDNIDDHLFDRANKAQSTQGQQIYFDAMREIRRKRDRLEDRFKNQFVDFFNANVRQGASIVIPTLAELSLVATDEVEQELAVGNVVSKLKSDCQEELYALDCRMGVLLGDPELAYNSNPISPESICTAFKDACEELDIDLEIKLVLLKLFDKYVSHEIRDIYQHLNQHLAAKAVLPKIRIGSNPRGKTTSNEVVKQAVAQAEAANIGTGDLATVVQRLLVPDSLSQGALGRASSVRCPQLDTLTAIQQGDFSDLSMADPSFAPASLSSTDQNILRDLKHTSVVRGLSPLDSAVIDVVAMLFDYIFDDEAIPCALKALIGRLQIPLLKVALIDKEVFSRQQHPARRLLDLMADAGAGLNDEIPHDSDVFLEIDRIVTRVSEEFVDDINIFAELVDDLQIHLNHTAAHAKVQADNIAHKLREKEREVVADVRALEALKRRLDKHQPEEFIAQFLTEQWRQVLTKAYLAGGAHGRGWRLAISTMDELIWSAQKKASADQRRRLAQTLASLVGHLKTGMQTVGMPITARRDFLSRLANTQVAQVIKGLENPTEPPEAHPQADEAIRQGLATVFGDKYRTSEERPDPSPAADTEVGVSERAIAQVTELELGDWIELSQAQGEQLIVRFTWISPHSGLYLFTTREGRKAYEASLQSLALDFAAGKATRLEGAPDPLFARAIGDLMNKMEAH